SSRLVFHSYDHGNRVHMARYRPVIVLSHIIRCNFEMRNDGQAHSSGISRTVPGAETRVIEPFNAGKWCEPFVNEQHGPFQLHAICIPLGSFAIDPAKLAAVAVIEHKSLWQWKVQYHVKLRPA